MKKQIEFSAKFDTAEFDRDIDRMQRKLKEIYAPADAIRAQNNARMMQGMGMGGMISSGPSGQGAKREFDQLIREQAKSQELLGKQIVKRTEELKKMRSEQVAMIKGSQEELEIKEKIARVEENSSRMRITYKNQESSLSQMLDARQKATPQGIDRLMTAYRYGGFGGAATAAGRMVGGMGWGGIGSALGVIGAGAQAAGASYRDYTRMPIETAIASGNAIQGSIGRDLSSVYGGRTAFDITMFSAERQKAMAKAQEAYRGSRIADILGVGGLAAGAAGAGIGAIAGPAGAGAIGGLAATGYGIYNLATNQRSRDAFMSIFSDRYRQRYQATRSETAMQDFRDVLEAEKNRSPIKRLAAEEFEKNMGRNLEAQRAMGLTNRQFYGTGGFLNRVTGAGFTQEMGIGMANQILGAGGSARMAANSALGLQMQRMGVTNAGNILGTLSGGIQSPEANKRAVISIMSEAFKIGLDNAEFSEETRRFTQAAADIVTRVGATGTSDQERISANLGQFLGQRTNLGVQAAAGAYEAFQQRGSELGGRRGTLRMVEAMQNPDLQGLNQTELTGLLEMRPEEMTSNNPKMAFFAQKTGKSIEELRNAVTGVNRGARYTLPGQRKQVEQYAAQVSAYAKSTGKTFSDIADMQSRGELPKEISAALGGLVVSQGLTEQRTGMREELARAGEEFAPVSKEDIGFGKTIKDSVEAQLRTSTRTEDKFIQSAAADAEVVRKNFEEMSGEMDKAAEAATKMTSAIRQMAIEFNAAAKEKGGVPENLVQRFFDQNAGVQPQGGKVQK